MALGDILGWISTPCYFPTDDSLLWRFFLALRKLHHRFIPWILTNVSSKTSPKSVGRVRTFQTFPPTWFMRDFVHLDLEKWQGRNWPFPLIFTIGFLHCMFKLSRKIYYSILSKKCIFGYACDWSYTRDTIIILVQLFCSIFFKNKRSITHFITIIVT